MQIVIDIPEKEFGIDIDDKFKDFFTRLRVEINGHLISNTNLVCGAYELETVDMFLKAFNDSVPLPKGHGDLIDRNGLLEYTDINTNAYIPVINRYEIITAPTIIEADEEESEVNNADSN